MSSSIALRHARHLCTTTAAAATATAAKLSGPLSISQTKSKLRHEYDPDMALQIYSSFTSSNNHSSSTSSVRYAQEFTVRRLAKSHRFSDIESFLESHKTLPQITEEAFLASLIRSYGVAGMFENALKTFDEMTDLGTPRSSLSFNALLTACVHSKLFDRVPSYFNEIPAKYGLSPDKFSYGILIKAYCEMGSPEMAIEKLNEMEEKGIEVTPVTFTTILHGLYKKGRNEEAESFWDERVTKKGCIPDVGAYNVRLMHIHGGEVEGVKKLIDEMSNAGIKPDAISYNYLMTSYCKNGMMDEAKKVYDELGSKGCNPNTTTFRTLVFYLCEQGRHVTGYKVFKESVKLHKIPDFNTLKYLAEGLAKNGHKNEVKAMIRTMNKKFPPNMLKAWGKLVEDLGLAPIDTNEFDSGESEMAST
ncbi:pentatricopeptide repeat-containing At4g36680, mitochondrial-like [Olea europaea subsp. europaea]|uniref:Pentatricopeptide repeat-containing At4g36680, mitochondrial-like n=1 Tax=Olea europaea subsp. europaea TaxID=158383 RepID=A0A8S0SMG2_OLEEU|nr:pentatricopeptide repeat-containing At4g36680, mitochondrial-like [Olea europaea subsp. europaea]